jgi:hypothetical protein
MQRKPPRKFANAVRCLKYSGCLGWPGAIDELGENRLLKQYGLVGARNHVGVLADANDMEERSNQAVYVGKLYHSTFILPC